MKHILLTFCLVIRFLSGSNAQSSFDSLPFVNPLRTALDSALHERARDFFIETKAPGLEIAVSIEGKRIYYSYGYADRAAKRSFDSTVIVEAGSITKTFTANLLLQLQSRGKIDLSKTLKDYFPQVKGNDSVLSSIRLSELASHLSGLPRLPDNMDKTKSATAMQPYVYTKDDLMAYLAKARISGQDQYAYSNLGFGLLGTIAETITGTSYEQLLRSYLLLPLGMSDSYTGARTTKADTVTGYFGDTPAAYWTFDCMAGAGALKTNASDMLRYLEAMLPPVHPQFAGIYQTLTTPKYRIGPAVQICYGWHTMERMANPVYWHNGGTYGFSTFAAFAPENQCAIFAVSNRFNVNAALDRLSMQLMMKLVGKK